MKRSYISLLVMLGVQLLCSSSCTGKEETATSGLGPLESIVFTGNEDNWSGRLVNGTYVLENHGETGGIRYFYASYDKRNLGKRSASVDVRIDGGDGSGRAGLLYGYQNSPKTYYMILASATGDIEIYKRDNTGVHMTMGSSRAPKEGFYHLEVVEKGHEVQVLVDGENVSSFSSRGTGTGALGIAAMGLGRFTFTGYRQKPDREKRQQMHSPSNRQVPPDGQPPAYPGEGQTPPMSSGGYSQAGWVADQTGPVSLRRPADWRLHPISRDGQIRLSSPQGETLVIWPFYLRQRLATQGAIALVQRMTSLAAPGARCGNAMVIESNAVRCVGQQGGNTAISGMSWKAGSGFSAGYFYYVAGPEHVLRQNRQLYAQVIDNLSIRGSAQINQGGSGAPRPRLQYRRWMDPAEQAFTLEIPRGWQARGGLVRRASVDVTPALEITSPDGQIRLFVGDANVPVFALPNQTLSWTGYTEGSWYSPGYGVRMMVMRYKPGVNFAAEYVQSAFGRRYSGFQMTGSRDLPEASQAINRIYQQSGMPGFVQQLTTGEVRFSCQGNGGMLAGYCFAGTEITQAYGSGIWTVKYLFGYLAPQQRAEEAEAALAHMAATITLNPAWVQMQQGLTGNVSRIITETGNYISNVISQSYESQQRSQDEMARRYSNYIRGTEDVRDPNTGETYKVESSSNYYWIDAGRTIVGTDLDANPDVTRFQQMIRLP